MVKTSSKKSRFASGRKKWLLGLLVLVLLASGAWAIRHNGQSGSQNSGQTTSNPSPKNGGKPSVNLEPPTNEQQNAARDKPAPAQIQTNSDGRKVVNPIITSYDSQEVRAFVNGVIEDGGTCTATYTHKGDVVTASSNGISDAGHTTCGPMRPPGPVNIPGDWSVTVTYSSGGYFGKSDAKSFKVQ